MARHLLRRPGRPQIPQPRLDRFDAEPDPTAAGKIEEDGAAWRLAFFKRDGQERQHGIARALQNAVQFDRQDAFEMEAAPAAFEMLLSALFRPFPHEAAGDKGEAVFAFEIFDVGGEDQRILHRRRDDGEIVLIESGKMQKLHCT